MKRPLEKCINGCDRPVQHPSWVLCICCLADLDGKMQQLKSALTPKASRKGWSE